MTSSDILCNPRGWTEGLIVPIENTMKDCLHVAEELVEDKDEYSSELCDLKKSMTKLSELVCRTNKLGDVMLDIQQEIERNQDETTAPDLVNVFHTKIRERSSAIQSEAPGHPRMKEFDDLMSTRPSSDPQLSQEETVGVGIVIGQVEVSLTCPLAKTLMVDPVKNKKCGHSFSKQAILHHIRKYRQNHRKEATCPIGGCNVKLKEADFEPNADLEKAIRKKEREERRGRKEKENNAVVV